ncbi:MAG: helix-turn-helix transcriptional regulator [Clostridia bacterium]|nr:helix-turn-helix transcriptional regulator [Clostridia bacterium]
MTREWLRDQGAYWTAGEVREYGRDFFTKAYYPTGERGLRLIVMTGGTAHASSCDGDIWLGGSRMLLSFLDYRPDFTEVSADAGCLTVDIIPTRDAPIGDSLYDMYDKYPQYRRFCQNTREALTFIDGFGCVYATVEALMGLSSDRWIFSRMYACYIILVITCHADESSRMKVSGNRYVRNAMKYVNDNCSMPITVKDVSRSAGVNEGHLRRLFRQETGTPLGEYIQSRRMDRARFLLIHTGFPISHISRLVGFSSQQYLSEAFRRRFGITPGELRKSYNITCGYDELEGYVSKNLPWEVL